MQAPIIMIMSTHVCAHNAPVDGLIWWVWPLTNSEGVGGGFCLLHVPREGTPTGFSLIDRSKVFYL